MKKIILISLLTISLACAQAQVPALKAPNGLNVQGKSLTGTKVQNYDNGLVKLNDNVNNEDYFPLKADSTLPRAGSYATRYDFERELVASRLERISIATGGLQKVFPATPNPIATSGSSMLDGNMYFTLFIINRAITVTTATYMMATSGSYTGDAVNGIALYKDDGSGTLTKVAESANTVNCWTITALTTATLNFTDGYTMQPGIYYLGALYNSSAQTTAPQIYYCEAVGPLVNAILPYPVSGKLAAQSTFPASTTVASIRATSGTPLAFYLK